MLGSEFAKELASYTKEQNEEYMRLQQVMFFDAVTYGRCGNWNPKKGEYTSPSGALFIYESLKNTRYEN